MQIVRTDGFPRNAMLRAIADADVLWVHLRHQIDRQVMDAAPNLRCIVTPCTGTDHLDLAEASRRGVAVLSLQGDTEFLRGIPATSEATLGLILALLRRIPAAAEHTRQGGWDRTPFLGTDLAGKSVGIVGLGRIGRHVERRLWAFGASPVMIDDFRDRDRFPLCELDILTLHVPLSEETRGMVDAGAFAAMRRGSYLVNTSRGQIVDEAALLEALESGHLAGAALDVVCGERTGINDRLVAFSREHPERLIIVPHIGGYSVESLERVERRMSEKLDQWIRYSGPALSCPATPRADMTGRDL